ncbi:uncharacterized protein LOC124722110 [Schistocerca piceifrons]|uniref:uncharacterized protein LOC124722110 n=1 Tax=Schistocerca piceifrons TaxID=274613 RepID=UPI001F5EA072|nr:uncharacterized protein LOC124722110 [Schistocerca piceifrons]
MKDQGRTPLRTILQNFLNHVENLDNQKVDGSYEKEFQELKLFSEVLKTSEQYCCSEGQKEVNRKKNRYKDILPFDISRVVLDGYAGVPGSDYINANFIKGASGSLAYIASQGPLPHTVNDFWRMVVECKVQVIVMACNEEEAGKHKCENYWVEEEGQEKQFGMVTVRLVKASVVCPDFLVRTMMLKYTNSQSVTEHRTVCQFHYSAWPDHGVPPLVRPLLDMVRLVRDTQASETLPVLIHCSAGCGRTGTICAIDYVLGLLRAGKLTSDFSLFNLVREMRKQRTAMVQTKEQYVLVHHAVRELFCEQLRMIDSHPYENIDLNGMPLVKETTDSNLEPTYEVIETPCEEKQDIREKEISNSTAPPLPHKKRLSTAASKQEKEVENLTEKQRLASERTSVSEESVSSSVMTSVTSTQKPRIAKLKAIFERNLGDLETTNPPTRVRHSQQVTRSHSLGAVCKPDLKQLSPSRFGQSETKTVQHNVNEPKEESSSSHCSGFQPALPIKRSKSLRVLGSSDQSKLSLVSVGKGNLVKSQKFCGSESVSSGKCIATQQAKDCTVNHKSSGTNISHHFEGSERRGLETGTVFNQPSLNSCPPKFSDRAGAGNEQRYDGGQKLHGLANSVSDRSSSLECCGTEELKGNLRKVQGMSVSGGGGSSSSSSMESEAKAALWPQNRSTCQSNLSKTDLDDRRGWKDSKQCATNLVKYAVCQHRNSLSSGQSHASSSVYVKPVNQGLYGEIQKKVSSIVTGLGVRERRNSFRQAVSTDKVSGSDTRCVKCCESDSVWSKSDIQVRDAKTLSDRQESNSKVLIQSDLVQGAKIYSNLSPHSHADAVHPVVQDERGERNARAGGPQPHNSQNKIKCSSVRTEKNPVNCCSEAVNRKCIHQRAEEQRVAKPVKESKISPHVCRDEKVSCVMCEPEGRNQHRKVESTYSKYSRILPVGRKLSQPAWVNHEQLTSSVIRDSSSSGSRLDPQQSHYLHDMKPELTVSAKPSFVPQTERYDDIVTNRVSSSEVSYHKGFLNKPVPPPSKQKPTLVSKAIRGNSASKNEREPCPGQSSASTSAQFFGEQSTVGSDSVFVKNVDVSQQQTQHVDRLVRRTVCKEREEGNSKLLAATDSQPFARNVAQSSGPDFKKTTVTVDQHKYQHSSGHVPALGQDEKLSARHKHASLKEINRSDDSFSYGLVAGVQLRQGSQDDSACSCPNVAPKVRRHASVVLLRHSLIETAPLSVWSRDHQGRAPRVPNVKPPLNQEGTAGWGTAAGVDVDFVAASMKSQGKPEASFPRNTETQHLQRHTQHSYPDVPQRTAGAEGVTSPHLVRKQHYL